MSVNLAEPQRRISVMKTVVSQSNHTIKPHAQNTVKDDSETRRWQITQRLPFSHVMEAGITDRVLKFEEIVGLL
jgi:hypothetical protein